MSEEKPSLGSRRLFAPIMGWGFTSRPWGLSDESRSLSPPPCPSPAHRGRPRKGRVPVGPLGPGSRMSGLEAPGNDCSEGAGGRKGPERWAQSAGREGGRGGAKDARLGGWSWRLPRRQQGPSWQGPGREPRPGERARAGEVRRDALHLHPLPFPLPGNFLSPLCTFLSSSLGVRFLGAAWVRPAWPLDSPGGPDRVRTWALASCRACPWPSPEGTGCPLRSPWTRPHRALLGALCPCVQRLA